MEQAPTILVVDDEDTVRTLLRNVLELAGFTVLEASHGAAALDVLRTRSVSAVLLDRTMPDVSGFEVLDAIRSNEFSALVPVLIVSGHDDVDDRVEGLRRGADDYITKPFEPDEILARVQAHLRGQQAWIERLTDTLEARRATLLAAAAKAGQTAGYKEAAATLCAELIGGPDVSGACILEVAGSHQAMLATAGVSCLDELRLAGRWEAAQAIRDGLRHGPTTTPAGALTVAAAPVSYRERYVGAVALCGPRTNPEADGRLLATAIDFAGLVSGVLSDSLRESALRSQARSDVLDIISSQAFRPVFQPIVSLVDRHIIGYEALTRFEAGIDTEALFVDAARLGAGLDLELATLAASIEAATTMPTGLVLALNVSPTMLLDPERLGPVLSVHTTGPIILEVSELEPVDDYDQLRDAVSRLPHQVEVSVDDAGSGFASLAHVLALRARYVKLDRTWVDGIDRDPAKRALVAGLQSFAVDTGASLIAEGVEAAGELDALIEIGIELGQGFLLGRPDSF